MSRPEVQVTMRFALPALAVLIATALPVRAAAPAAGMDALDAAAQPPQAEQPYAQRTREDEAYWRPRRQMQAREGMLLSFGLGGGSAYLSSQGPGRVGAFDLDFRLGYGFSDRFQLFMDFGADAGNYPDQSTDFTSWMFTIRGQTVLISD